jgi:hypothetical protein
MAKLTVNLAPMQAARDGLAKQRLAQRDAAVRLKAAQAALAAALRSGASGDAIQRQQAAVAALQSEGRAALADTAARLVAMTKISERLRGRRDPGDMVQALDTAHPVMLLPVAVQTRYDDKATTLMIRIYPDAIHTFGHEPGLGDGEIVAGKSYWTQRFAVPGDADSPWQQIVRFYAPPRAAWIVRSTTPTNAAAIGTMANGEPVAPAFDDTAIPRADPTTPTIYATALPDRFVAIGQAGGKEIFRKWGVPVADLLAMSPAFDPLLVDDPDNHDPFGKDRAWMVDYQAALAAGMAISIVKADLKNGAKMSGRIDRLIVLGVDWTQTPESAAALVASLLDNHQNGAGLSFVAQGTPTNNTADVRAGFAANGADVAAALHPATADARAESVAVELASAGARLQRFLGLPADLFDSGVIPGSDLSEGATSGHMVNALWNATLGYTLRYFWNPIATAQSLLSDDAIAQLRAWAVRYVRPGGPLSALRVGKQPYGILPITARGHVAAVNAPLERELLKIVEWFRWGWDDASKRVPNLSDPSAENLHQVLAMQPWPTAKRYWEVAGPAAAANYPDIASFFDLQHLVIAGLLSDLLDDQIPANKIPFIATCGVRPKPHALDAVPWVQRNPDQPQGELDGNVPLARNFIASLRQLLSAPTGNLRGPLTAMQNGESLLEAMLGFAADEEVLQSSHDLFYGHVKGLGTVSLEAKASAQRFRVAEYVGVDNSALVGDQVDVNNARTLLGLKLTGTTGNQTIEEHIGARLGLPRVLWPEHMTNIATFADSLTALQDKSAGELQIAFRSALDLFANRIDAWITSLATRRLDGMRDSSAEGLHLGAFGVVENLLPDLSARPSQSLDSLGYVHAPSLQQATTASVLRSAFLANKQAAGNAFDIDLRSRRVKRAKRLLEGLANGQSMAALLGYRFERALRDGGMPQFMLECRRAFPLKPAGTTASDEPQEAIAARDVVDGVRLMDAYRNAKATFAITGVPAALTHAGGAIALLIEDLLDQMDSVSDLLVSESVYQMVGGSMEGAGAAMLTLDKQSRPPDPRVVETPHSTRGYTQRVVVAMQSDDAGPWAGLSAGDLAARVEPRLNAWLARLLGDPAQYEFVAKVLVAPATPGDPWVENGTTLTAGIAELGLSPLALVQQSEAQQGGGQSGVQERIATLFGAMLRADVGAAADQMAVLLQRDAATPDRIGLVAFESYAWLLRRLLAKTRELRRMDLVKAQDGVETDATQNDGEAAGVDLAELQARVAIAEGAAQTVLDALQAASDLAPDDPSTLDPDAPATLAIFASASAALAQAYALGWRSASASAPVPAVNDAQGAQVAAGDSAARAIGRVRALHGEVAGRIAVAQAAKVSAGLGGQVVLALGRIGAVMGKDFPVLPMFSLGAYATDAAASLGDRAALLAKAELGNDDTAIAGWLPKLACVRESTALLSDALTAAEALAATSGYQDDALDWKLVQFPRDAAARWGALPPAPAQDLRGTVAVAIHAPGALAAFTADALVAGLFVDEWMESIPSNEETTGLGFHFDASGARPPQSILLAVPADPAAQNWTLDGLVDVVNEAMALARVRAVRPQDLQALGLILPGIYLSNNFKQDVPSVDFSGLLAKNLAILRNAGAVHGSATMALGKTLISG